MQLEPLSSLPINTLLCEVLLVALSAIALRAEHLQVVVVVVPFVLTITDVAADYVVNLQVIASKVRLATFHAHILTKCGEVGGPYALPS